MKWTKNTGLIIAMLVVASVAVVAATIKTTVWFNVPTIVSYSLTLPGAGTFNDTPGQDFTAAIEFNSTATTTNSVEATVVGGTAQTATTPIFTYDNTGTVPINVSVLFDAAIPACATVFGGTTYGTWNLSIDDTTPAVINSALALNSQVNLSMQANFTNCGVQTTQVNLTTTGQ